MYTGHYNILSMYVCMYEFIPMLNMDEQTICSDWMQVKYKMML